MNYVLGIVVQSEILMTKTKPCHDITLRDPIYNFNTEKTQVNNTLDLLRTSIINLEDVDINHKSTTVAHFI